MYPSVIDYHIFSEALAIIYCVLTDEECLRLALRHNANGHFTHKLTHEDYVRNSNCM